VRVGGRRGALKKKFKPVDVTYEDGKVTVDPSNVTLYFNHTEDSVRWRVKGNYPKDTYFAVIWESESPFLTFGFDPGKKEFVGTGNTRIAGRFKYSVVFVAEDGSFVGIDPDVENNEGPPP
jgi:hypothetical protein